jgi:hypothetical protein
MRLARDRMRGDCGRCCSGGSSLTIESGEGEQGGILEEVFDMESISRCRILEIEKAKLTAA